MDLYVQQVEHYLAHQDQFLEDVLRALEDVLSGLGTFLREHGALYELRQPQKEPMREAAIKWRAEIEKQFGGSNFDAVARRFLAPNFHIIFDADDEIDGDADTEKQRKILTKSLDAIRNKRLDQLPFPTAMQEALGRDILTCPEKWIALTKELEAEVRLLDSEISWVDAALDRIRIATYSAILCINETAVRDMINQYKDRRDLAEEARRIAEEKIGKTDLTLERALRLGVLAAAMVTTGDDYIDLEEDIAKKKNTGMTLCDNPPALYTSVLVYSQNQMPPEEYLNGYERWVIEFFIWFYHDSEEVIRFVNSQSSLAANFIYKRKETNPSNGKEEA
jgi:hypothetical protein